MSMHLVGPYLTTTNYSKRKIKMTAGKQAKLQEQWHKHNKWLKSIRLPKITYEEYEDYITGRKKAPVKAVARSPFETKSYVRETPHYPSISNTDLKDYKKDLKHACAKKEPNVYSGERKLLGIAIMHKSNLVPVFDKKDAEDIAKMRRG